MGLSSSRARKIKAIKNLSIYSAFLIKQEAVMMMMMLLLREHAEYHTVSHYD